MTEREDSGDVATEATLLRTALHTARRAQQGRPEASSGEGLRQESHPGDSSPVNEGERASDADPGSADPGPGPACSCQPGQCDVAAVCSVCPVCRGAAIVRDVGPEVLLQLADIATYVGRKLRSAAEAWEPRPSAPAPDQDVPGEWDEAAFWADPGPWDDRWSDPSENDEPTDRNHAEPTE